MVDLSEPVMSDLERASRRIHTWGRGRLLGFQYDTVLLEKVLAAEFAAIRAEINEEREELLAALRSSITALEECAKIIERKFPSFALNVIGAHLDYARAALARAAS